MGVQYVKIKNKLFFRMLFAKKNPRRTRIRRGCNYLRINFALVSLRAVFATIVLGVIITELRSVS